MTVQPADAVAALLGESLRPRRHVGSPRRRTGGAAGSTAAAGGSGAAASDVERAGDDDADSVGDEEDEIDEPSAGTVPGSASSPDGSAAAAPCRWLSSVLCSQHLGVQVGASLLVAALAVHPLSRRHVEGTGLLRDMALQLRRRALHPSMLTGRLAAQSLGAFHPEEPSAQWYQLMLADERAPVRLAGALAFAAGIAHAHESTPDRLAACFGAVRGEAAHPDVGVWASILNMRTGAALQPHARSGSAAALQQLVREGSEEGSGHEAAGGLSRRETDPLVCAALQYARFSMGLPLLPLPRAVAASMSGLQPAGGRLGSGALEPGVMAVDDSEGSGLSGLGLPLGPLDSQDPSADGAFYDHDLDHDHGAANHPDEEQDDVAPIRSASTETDAVRPAGGAEASDTDVNVDGSDGIDADIAAIAKTAQTGPEPAGNAAQVPSVMPAAPPPAPSLQRAGTDPVSVVAAWAGSHMETTESLGGGTAAVSAVSAIAGRPPLAKRSSASLTSGSSAAAAEGGAGTSAAGSAAAASGGAGRGRRDSCGSAAAAAAAAAGAALVSSAFAVDPWIAVVAPSDVVTRYGHVIKSTLEGRPFSRPARFIPARLALPAGPAGQSASAAAAVHRQLIKEARRQLRGAWAVIVLLTPDAVSRMLLMRGPQLPSSDDPSLGQHLAGASAAQAMFGSAAVGTSPLASVLHVALNQLSLDVGVPVGLPLVYVALGSTRLRKQVPLLLSRAVRSNANMAAAHRASGQNTQEAQALAADRASRAGSATGETPQIAAEVPSKSPVSESSGAAAGGAGAASVRATSSLPSPASSSAVSAAAASSSASIPQVPRTPADASATIHDILADVFERCPGLFLTGTGTSAPQHQAVSSGESAPSRGGPSAQTALSAANPIESLLSRALMHLEAAVEALYGLTPGASSSAGGGGGGGGSGGQVPSAVIFDGRQGSMEPHVAASAAAAAAGGGRARDTAVPWGQSPWSGGGGGGGSGAAAGAGVATGSQPPGGNAGGGHHVTTSPLIREDAEATIMPARGLGMRPGHQVLARRTDSGGVTASPHVLFSMGPSAARSRPPLRAPSQRQLGAAGGSGGSAESEPRGAGAGAGPLLAPPRALARAGPSFREEAAGLVVLPVVPNVAHGAAQLRLVSDQHAIFAAADAFPGVIDMAVRQGLAASGDHAAFAHYMRYADVLHFTGHSDPDNPLHFGRKNSSGRVEASTYTVDGIVARVRSLRTRRNPLGPSLVVLMGCNTAHLAYQIAQAAFPHTAVIGWASELADATGNAFCDAFYRKLFSSIWAAAEEQEQQAAFERARAAMDAATGTLHSAMGHAHRFASLLRTDSAGAGVGTGSGTAAGGSVSLSSIRAISGSSADGRSGSGSGAIGGAGFDSAALLKPGAPISRASSGNSGTGGGGAVGGAGAGAAFSNAFEAGVLPGSGIGFHLVQAAFMHAVAATQVRGPEGHEENLLMPINITRVESLGRKRRRLHIPATDPAAGPVAYGNPGGVPLLVVPVVPAAKLHVGPAAPASSPAFAGSGAAAGLQVADGDPMGSGSRTSSAGAAAGPTVSGLAVPSSAGAAPPRFVLPPMFDPEKLVAKRLLSEAAKATQANAVEAGLGTPCCEHRVVGTAAGGSHPCAVHGCPVDVPPFLQSRMHVLCEPVPSHSNPAGTAAASTGAGAAAAGEVASRHASGAAAGGGAGIAAPAAGGPALQPCLQSSVSSVGSDPQPEPARSGSSPPLAAPVQALRGMLQCSVGLDARYYGADEFAAELRRIRTSYAGSIEEAAAAQTAVPVQPRCQVIDE